MDSSDVKRLLNGDFVRKMPATTTATPVTVEITIPLPPSQTYPNSRHHWKAVMNPKKQQRQTAYAAALDATSQWSRQPFWKLAECQATFYLDRRRDGDNLLAWLKASFDGLQDAGIIFNDGGFVHMPPKQITAKEANGERKVVLVITERH